MDNVYRHRHLKTTVYLKTLLKGSVFFSAQQPVQIPQTLLPTEQKKKTYQSFVTMQLSITTVMLKYREEAMAG